MSAFDKLSFTVQLSLAICAEDEGAFKEAADELRAELGREPTKEDFEAKADVDTRTTLRSAVVLFRHRADVCRILAEAANSIAAFKRGEAPELSYGIFAKAIDIIAEINEEVAEVPEVAAAFADIDAADNPAAILEAISRVNPGLSGRLASELSQKLRADKAEIEASLTSGSSGHHATAGKVSALKKIDELLERFGALHAKAEATH